MKRLLRTIADGVASRAVHARVRSQVSRDLARANPEARRLLQVLSRTLRDDFADADRAWFSQVEELRATLAASQERVQVMDFGAGSPDSTRTAEEMQRGVAFEATIGDICQRSSKPAFWARMLFAVVLEYQPLRGIELGTCLAISAAYQSGALQLAGNGGTLHTLEGADSLAEQARHNLARLGIGNVTVVAGRFDQTLDGVLDELGRVDYAFIDGHHDQQATVAHFRQLMPVLAPEAVLVFDDISWSPGMQDAWRAISADPRVRVVVDLRAVGICVLGDAAAPKASYQHLLP